MKPKSTIKIDGTGLRNPCCGYDRSKVFKTEKGCRVIVRYRACDKCDGRFSTIELVERLISQGGT